MGTGQKLQPRQHPTTQVELLVKTRATEYSMVRVASFFEDKAFVKAPLSASQESWPGE